MSDQFCFDITVERSEANFDRACEHAKKMADTEVEKHTEAYEKKCGEWLSQESMTITFRSYRYGINNHESVHIYHFCCVVVLKD